MTDKSESYWAHQLARLRWPEGWRCSCGCTEHYHLRARPRVLQCKRCRRQQSVTAGTIMHRTRLSLHQWVVAIRCIARGSGISARSLARELSVHLETAWQLLQRIQSSMKSEKRPLEGALEWIVFSARCRRPTTLPPPHRARLLCLVDELRHVKAFVGLPSAVLPYLVRQHAPRCRSLSKGDFTKASWSLVRTLRLRLGKTHRGVSERWLAIYARAAIFLWRSWQDPIPRAIRRAPERTVRAVLSACLVMPAAPFRGLMPRLAPAGQHQVAA